MAPERHSAVAVDDTLDLAAFHRVARGAPVVVPTLVWARIHAAAATLAGLLETGTTIYGVTTGYGAGSGRIIEAGERPRFQLATLRSHACGTGPLLSWPEARGVWLSKLASVATGRTGASPALAQGLVDLLNAGLSPAVPATGSLGASGDLIPSAHAGLPLVGEGHVLDRNGSVRDADKALGELGIKPIALGPRDGLSLVNGTAVTLSLAAHACRAAACLAATAEWLAAAGLEAIGGHDRAFSHTVTQARPHAGVGDACASVRAGLAGIDPSRLEQGGVHDPYAWRCVPQVHGAVRSAIAWATATCQVELTSCSDNPIIGDDGSISSGGNFHGAPLGLVMEAVRLGAAELCGLSRQRIAQLAAHGDGLTMVLTTATASLLEITSTGTATGHWLPVDEVEDHVSNATLAARRTQEVLAGGWNILAAEALALARVLPAPPTSAAAKWLLHSLDDLGVPAALDQPLGATLTAVAAALALAGDPGGAETSGSRGDPGGGNATTGTAPAPAIAAGPGRAGISPRS